MFVKDFGIKCVGLVGVGAECHMVIGSPAGLGFGAPFCLVVFYAVENEGECWFAELMMVEGCGQNFGDCGFVRWRVVGVAGFWVGEL